MSGQRADVELHLGALAFCQVQRRQRQRQGLNVGRELGVLVQRWQGAADDRRRLGPTTAAAAQTQKRVGQARSGRRFDGRNRR